MKKLLLFIIGFLLVLVCRPAYASDEVINIETGSGSENTSSIIIEKIEKVVNTNTVKIYNNVSGDVNSGFNQASNNTGTEARAENEENDDGVGGGSKVNAGNASINVVIENSVNTNKTSIFPKKLEPEKDENVEPGKGGGAELVAADTSGTGGAAETLPSTGPNEVDQLAALLGLPLIGSMLIRIAELLKKKKLSLN